MKKILKKAYKSVIFSFYYLYALVDIPIEYQKSYKNGELRYLSHDDFIVWKKAMLNMLKTYCLYRYS